MKKLKAQVEELSNEELKRAMIKKPLFVDEHQGYAVIKEEIEEAGEELEIIKFNFEILWNGVRNDSLSGYLIDICKDLKQDAICLAAEAIQVAAMAQKFIDSFKEDNTNE